MANVYNIHLYTKPENMGFVWVWCARKSFPINMDYKNPVKSVLIDNLRTEDEWKRPQLPDQGNSKTRRKQNSIKEVILATLLFPLLFSDEKLEQRLSAGSWLQRSQQTGGAYSWRSSQYRRTEEQRWGTEAVDR